MLSRISNGSDQGRRDLISIHANYNKPWRFWKGTRRPTFCATFLFRRSLFRAGFFERENSDSLYTKAKLAAAGSGIGEAFSFLDGQLFDMLGIQPFNGLLCPGAFVVVLPVNPCSQWLPRINKRGSVLRKLVVHQKPVKFASTDTLSLFIKWLNVG